MLEFYDPLYGRIEIPERYEPIVNSKYFRRLQYLRQLGLCYLSFPGGNHTRFEHSIGVFYLAGLVQEGLRKSTVAKIEECERLGHMIRIAALCHDIGHGPFSHMSEDVLLGMGANISHEQLGAAIVTHLLSDELEAFEDLGISCELIGTVIAKGFSKDNMFSCALGLVSSDLDLDRLDYLQRDAHYAGFDPSTMASVHLLPEAWRLNRISHTYTIELTDQGVEFAEAMLFLRRNNYRRIVFNSRHMSATGMFEKALGAALASGSHFAGELQHAIETRIAWDALESVEKGFDTVWRVYGMVDYEALKRIEESCESARYLIRMIRLGKTFESVQRLAWEGLHYSVKNRLLGFGGVSDYYQYRRRIESYLAQGCGVENMHVVAHVPEVRIPQPLLMGVEGGKTLDERTEIGQFLQRDFARQYAVEVFVDPQVDEKSRTKIANSALDIFKGGLEPEVSGDSSAY